MAKILNKNFNQVSKIVFKNTARAGKRARCVELNI
jgi:hypothetical protein